MGGCGSKNATEVKEGDQPSVAQTNKDSEVVESVDRHTQIANGIVKGNEKTQEALDILKDKEKIKKAWKDLDFNGNGIVSLAEIDKFCVEKKWDVSKPAMMRAYKQTTLKDGDGDSWVEKKEFPALLKNLFLCNQLWDVFDDIDTGDDRRIDQKEFKAGMAKIGCELTDEEAETEFKAIDKNGGGQILFHEFCAYIGGIVTPDEHALSPAPVKKDIAKADTTTDDSPEIKTKKFDELEDEIRQEVKAGETSELWSRVDYNGNGKVSLAEIDKWVIEKYPLLDNKPALMRAYKKTTMKDGDGDAWVERNEFLPLLRNLFYFNKVFFVYDQIDSDDDRRMDFAEFQAGVGKLGMELSEEDAKAEFDKMDKNDGGLVLFDEFCTWVAAKKCPVD